MARSKRGCDDLIPQGSVTPRRDGDYQEERDMGSNTFSNFRKTEDLTPSGRKKAFAAAVEQAQYDNGHAGYTGSIAEKSDHRFIGTRKTLEEARAWADELIDKGDSRVDDKWGPAGCIEVAEPKGFLFFGWASS
jgi:hypothetical protein